MSREFVVLFRQELQRRFNRSSPEQYVQIERRREPLSRGYKFRPTYEHEVNDALKTADQILQVNREKTISPPIKHEWQPRRKAQFKRGGVMRHQATGYRLIIRPIPSLADFVESRINAEFKQRTA